MNQIKREFMPLYSFYDRVGIAEHFEQMAEKGWLLEKMNAWCWQYRRIEPQKLQFTVTYFPKATQFDPVPADGLETFREFCAEAGWSLAAGNGQIQVFYNDLPSPIPMETDAEMDFENMHRAMKHFLSSYWLLLGLSIVETGFLVWRVLEAPVAQLSSMIQLNAFLGILPVMILTAVELLRYYRWRKRARSAIERGEPLPNLRSARTLIILIWIMVLVELVSLLTLSGANSPVMLFAVILMLGFMTLMILLSHAATGIMRRRKVKAWVNRLVTLVIIVILAAGMMVGLMALILKSNTLLPTPEGVETYEHNGFTIRVYHDELPLTVQDLVPTDYDKYSTQLTETSSLLLARIEGNQRPRVGDGDHPDLQYEVVIIKVPFLYTLCKNDFIDWLERHNDETPKEYRDEYRRVDSAVWGASEVYQRYSSDEPINQFLVCWPDRIAEVHFDWNWVITDEMISITAEKLKNA